MKEEIDALLARLREARAAIGRLDDDDEYQPDLRVFDECQRVKNLKASVTRRCRDYVRARRKVGARLNVVALSGTIMNRSLNDFGHIVDENGHLLSYAEDGIYTAIGYIETFRRRLDDPESD